MSPVQTLSKSLRTLKKSKLKFARIVNLTDDQLAKVLSPLLLFQFFLGLYSSPGASFSTSWNTFGFSRPAKSARKS